MENPAAFTNPSPAVPAVPAVSDMPTAPAVPLATRSGPIEDPRRWKIYIVRNRVTGQVSIGQTHKPWEDRWRKHCAPYSGCTKLRDDIQKYGQFTFDYEIVVRDIRTQEEANKLEKEYIKSCDSMYRKEDSKNSGYNVRLGGQGAVGFEGWYDKHRDVVQFVMTSKSMVSSRLIMKY